MLHPENWERHNALAILYYQNPQVFRLIPKYDYKIVQSGIMIKFAAYSSKT